MAPSGLHDTLSPKFLASPFDDESFKGFWEPILASARPLLFPSINILASRSPQGRVSLEHQLQGDLDVLATDAGVSVTALAIAAWALVLHSHASVTPDYVVLGWADARGVTLPFRPSVSEETSRMEFLRKAEFFVDQVMKLDYHGHKSELYQLYPDVDQLHQTVITFSPSPDSDSLEDFPLVLTVHYTNQVQGNASAPNVMITLSADPNCLLPEDAHWILEHFVAALHRLSYKPDLVLSCGSVDLKTNQELQDLQGWTPADPYHSSFKQTFLLHHLFEQQATRTPHKIAVQFEQESFISYMELDRRTEVLASVLVSQHSVKANQIIPILIDKSVDLVVAILGVLKAGAAWMPLDPDHPDERLRTIIGLPDEVPVVLASPGEKSERLSSILGADVDIVAVDSNALKTVIPQRVDVKTAPADLAYVLFTRCVICDEDIKSRDDVGEISGSTGTPKGVQVEHHSIVAAVLAWKALWPDGLPFARCLQFSNATFDPSIWDMFAILTTGGRLCLAPKPSLIADLNGALTVLDATFLITVPTVANFLVPEQVPSLQDLTLVGEPLTTTLRDAWAPHIRLLNTYGPTEISVICTFAEVHPDSDVTRVGHSYGDNEVLILNNDLSLTPIGVPGEICLSGPQLTRGYLNDLAQTQLNYVPHPFRRGDRIYRTGDIAARAGDGSLFYIGRRDNQVKFRGVRIELEEIAEVLRTDSRVRGVVVNKVKSDEKEELVAFIGLGLDQTSGLSSLRFAGPSVNTTALLTDLRTLANDYLPTTMLPTAWVLLESLPLTATGKTDRRLLNEFYLSQDADALWALNQHVSHRPAVPPRTEYEVVLRRAWSAVLGFNESRIGIDHSWYELGGDSVSAVKLSSHLRSRGILLRTTEIIQNPSIRLQGAIIIDGDEAHVALSSEVARSIPESLEHTTPDHLAPLLNVTPTQLDHIRNVTIARRGLLSSEIEDIFPCTPLQESMVAANMERSDVYVIRNQYSLSKSVDESRLRTAFNNLLDNTSALRTTFFLDSSVGFLAAVLRPGRTYPFTVIDVPGPVLQATTDHYSNGLSLDEVLLTSVVLIQCNGVPHTLIWAFHHGLVDGWTISLLEQDLFRLYERADSPARPRPSFKAVVDYLTRVDHSSSLAFWRQRLASVQPTIFPLDSALPTPAIANFSFRRAYKVAHHRLARTHGIKLSTLVTAAYAVVLSAHSGSRDEVVFGQVNWGRSLPIDQIEDIVGPCLGTVARNVAIAWDETVLTFLRGVQEDQVFIDQHHSIGLKEIQKNGITEIATLFKTILNFYQLPTSSRKDELFSQVAEIDGVDYPFVIFASGIDTSTVEIEARYSPTHIGQSEVELVIDHLGTCLASMVDRLDIPLHSIKMMSLSEEKDLLNEGAVATPLIDDLVQNGFSGIHHLIEAQAEKTPHKIAIQFEQLHFVSYHQLDVMANHLARRLINNGIGRVRGRPDSRGDQLVPILFDKSVEMVISILAILKSGGSYVPLDPEHPSDRISTIVSLAGAKIVLTSPTLRHKLSEVLQAIPMLQVEDIDFSSLESLNDRPSDIIIYPQDLCYVLFTSGSTGKPKGVQIEHSAIMESVSASQEVYGRRSDRVLQFSTYTFDVSVWDFFNTLTAGGRLCLSSRANLLSDLTAVMHSMDIQFLETTPTVATLLSHPLPNLQVLTVSGEMLSAQVKDTWAEEVILVNCYGPTEAAVNVTYQVVSKSSSLSNIGKRFGPNLTYILDVGERLRTVPKGCIGELYLGGPQVGRGYLNDPRQTERAFLTNPFADSTHTRLYKTGDLVRRNVDGTISYLGRKDTQVKLRGLRIEVAEIEQVILATDTSFSGAVVEKATTARGKDELVAFLPLAPTDHHDDVAFVASVEDAADFVGRVNVLRAAISLKLPNYMVPTVYIPMYRLPTTSAGKADRRGLIQILGELDPNTVKVFNGQGSPHQRDAHAPPETEIQAIIRALWARILDVEEQTIGIDDDFYRFGGDSISAIRLATAAREAELHLLATDIIRNPTVRVQAQVTEVAAIDHEFDVDDTPAAASLVHMIPQDLTLLEIDQEILGRLRDEVLPRYGLSAHDVVDIYPCTSLQTSMLIASSMVDDAYLVREEYDLQPGTNGSQLKAAFDTLIERNANLRTVYIFDPSLNGFQQVVMRPGWKTIEWTVIQVPSEADLDISITRYQVESGGRRFGNAELMTRACLFEVSGVPRRLVWIVHHSGEDAWAKYMLEAELEKIYRTQQLPRRRPYKLLIKYLQRLDRTAGLDFWKNKLLTATPTTYLQPPPGATRSTADTSISRRVHPGHSSLARQFGIMASTLATAAWGLVLAAHTGSNDVVFGQLVAGRSAPIRGIEDIVGVCINTVARRVIFDRSASIVDMLRAIQAEQIEISKHEYIGLQEIQNHGIPNISNLFRTLLNIRNLPGDQELYANEGNPNTVPRLMSGRGGTDGDDYPVDIFVSPYAQDSFALEVLFTKQVVSPAEVEVLLDHFEAALHFMTQHPSKSVGDIQLVGPKEAHRLVMGTNPAHPISPLLSPAQSMHQLIEEQALRTPQRIAVQFEQEHFITYRDLDALANGLARILREKGIRCGDLVGLYFDKSAEMIISLLASHKAGAGYVPLDPDHPAERVRTIQALAEFKVVLTSSKLDSRINAALGNVAESVVVDVNGLSPAEKLDAEPVGKEDICYVLFTSGTTGVPKGVVLTHGAIIESIRGSVEVYGPRSDRVLQFSNYTFDVSVWDWGATLTAGGRLCLAAKTNLLSNLAGTARDFDVTFMETTPTVAALITPHEIPSLRVLTVSGETLTAEVKSTWAHEVTLVNCYGPTEAAVNNTFKIVSPTTEGSNIGHQFGLNSIYALDDTLHLVPLGCVGELFISGPQVARGYLNNPSQTKTSFLADPFRPGQIMYATGDLVRLSPVDGSVTYLGRKDTQIKIRGLRVEVGEIEEVLKAASQSINNVVVFKVDAGHEELVAFVEYPTGIDSNGVPALVRDNKALTSVYEALRRAVSLRLPSYMAPARYAALNRFPRQPSGKLDRKAIIKLYNTFEKEIRELGMLAATSKVPPKKRTAAETKVMKLWQAVLKIKDDIDVDQPFTVMGGDSVGMMRLSGAAFKKGIALTITDLLKRSTIREQAQLVVGKK